MTYAVQQYYGFLPWRANTLLALVIVFLMGNYCYSFIKLHSMQFSFARLQINATIQRECCLLEKCLL
jgi:hypothetical protein